MIRQISSDEGSGIHQPFSLAAFSDKVQLLVSRATSHKEQQGILRRQIRQQRELNSKSDTEKEIHVHSLTKQLSTLRESHAETIDELNSKHAEMKQVMSQLDQLRQQALVRGQQVQTADGEALVAEREARKLAEEEMLVELVDRENQIQLIESDLAEARDDIRIAAAEHEEKLREAEKARQEDGLRIEKLESEIAVLSASKEAFTQSPSDLDRDLLAKADEFTHLESEVARLQTELTISRAELDSVYGTRTQRAAEVAANAADYRRELDQALNRQSAAEEARVVAVQRSEELQKELLDLVREFEELTMLSIEQEKEREELETLIDTLRDKIEDVEGKLAEERISGLGSTSKSVSTANKSASSEATGTSENIGLQASSLEHNQKDKIGSAVLKTEFKKLMRETRDEARKTLKVSRHPLLFPLQLSSPFSFPHKCSTLPRGVWGAWKTSRLRPRVGA